jgi:hypothetical protein
MARVGAASAAASSLAMSYAQAGLAEDQQDRDRDAGREGSNEALYAWGDTWKVNGHIWLIDPEEEPAYREFFAQVAAECGRTVSNAEQEKPRSRWRR